MDRDKGSLINEKQRQCAEAKENIQIYSLLPMSKRCPDTSWEVGPGHAQGLHQKTKALVTDVPLLLSHSCPC